MCGHNAAFDAERGTDVLEYFRAERLIKETMLGWEPASICKLGCCFAYKLIKIITLQQFDP